MSTERLSEFGDAKDQYEEDRLIWFTNDLLQELDNIGRNFDMNMEASKVVLEWVKDTILRLKDEYNDGRTN